MRLLQQILIGQKVWKPASGNHKKAYVKNTSSIPIKD
jgi:hypothetical protein